MATETLEHKAKPEHSTFRKVTEVGLGVLSAGSLVLNLIPGLNLVGAAVQGGVTVVQTGLDIADKNYKKAAISFVTGTIFTSLSLIPEVGAGAKVVGEGVELGATAVKTGEVAETVVNTARLGETLGNAAQATSTIAGSTEKLGFFARNWKKFGETLLNIPGVEPVYKKLLGHEAQLAATLGKSDKYVKAVNYLNTHNTARKVIKGGLFAGGMGLSFINDSPPANLLNPDTYPRRKKQDIAEQMTVEGDGDSPQFAARIRQERAQAALANNTRRV